MGNTGGWKYLLPLIPRYFQNLRLDGYELVLSSSHTFAMHVRAPAGALHVCYCHTPIRYAGCRRSRATAAAVSRAPGCARSGVACSRIDRRAAARPDSFVANSTAVQERIARFYGREATVVPPPVA